MMVMSRVGLICVALTSLALGRSGVAEPPTPGDAAPAQSEAEKASQEGGKKEGIRAERLGERAGKPAVLQFLRNRLTDLKDREAMLESALKRVEAGEDPAKIREEFEPRRTGRRDAGGSPRNEPDFEGDADIGRPGPGMPGGLEMAGRERPRAGGDKPPGPITAEDRERALQFLREHLPRVGGRVTELAKTSPKLADQMLSRFSAKIPELRAVQHDQELFELKVREMEGGLKIWEATRGYRDAASAKASDVESKKSELREALSSQYDAQLAIQRRHADRLAKRIDSLREDIQKRQADRDSTIDRQIEDVAAGRRPSGLGPAGREEKR